MIKLNGVKSVLETKKFRTLFTPVIFHRLVTKRVLSISILIWIAG